MCIVTKSFRSSNDAIIRNVVMSGFYRLECPLYIQGCHQNESPIDIEKFERKKCWHSKKNQRSDVIRKSEIDQIWYLRMNPFLRDLKRDVWFWKSVYTQKMKTVPRKVLWNTENFQSPKKSLISISVDLCGFHSNQIWLPYVLKQRTIYDTLEPGNGWSVPR